MIYTSKPKESGVLSKTPDSAEALSESLGKVTKGLGLELVDVSVSRRKGSVQIKLTVYRDNGPVSVNDCAGVHRAVLPRLELVFGAEKNEPLVSAKKPGKRNVRDETEKPQRTGPDLYVEVSSPGIDRLIKEGREFFHFTGRYVKCYRTDISGWTEGVLLSSDEEGVVLKTESGETRLCYEIIAKARLGRPGGA